jgi:hypothetical protein
VPGYHERLVVTPGITSLAQVVNGYDTEVESVRRQVALDQPGNTSIIFLLNDLRILARLSGSWSAEGEVSSDDGGRRQLDAASWKLQGLGHGSRGCWANATESGSTWSIGCRPVCWWVSSPATGTCPHRRHRQPLRQGAQFRTSASNRRLIRGQSTFLSILGMGSASASSK